MNVTLADVGDGDSAKSVATRAGAALAGVGAPLAGAHGCDTLCHMSPIRRISIRELHQRTGALVREAASVGYGVVVTDRGRPVATLTSYVERDQRRSFRNRVLLPEFAALTRNTVSDSAVGISDDRDRW